jgi:adenylate kinase family enzyme
MSKSRYKRIHVVGISGSGKSTLSQQIAEKLDLPYSELDAMFWRPGWKPAPTDEFIRGIRQVIAAERWVLDGRQDYGIHDVIGERAELVIWLDLPLHIITYRALKRTLRRALRREVLWAGNVEDWKLALAVWYRHSFRTFRQVRKGYQDLLEKRYPHATVIRLQSRSDVHGVLSQLEDG